MKLSELVNAVKKIHKGDPEIRIVSDGGFLKIQEVVSRKEYYDESLTYDHLFEKGNFVCLEIEHCD